MILPALAIAALLAAALPAEIQVVSFPSRGKLSVPLGAKGKADVERLSTVTKVSFQLDGVPAPHTVLAGMNALVVWVVSPEGGFENLGELEIDGAKAFLEATTRFDRFGILVTAEPHYMVDRPSSAAVFKNEAPRGVRSVPVTVRVGEYDYPGLPQAVRNVPPLVMQARAAVSIAASAQADRLAESEFRQARVSLETMEELVRRSSPFDVFAPSAHEAVRRAQRAFTLSRQSVR
jgi:hypothetical protein